MRSRAALASALVIALAVGVLIGRAGRGNDPSARLRATTLESQLARAAGERDRLEVERNQLEARLAAERAPAVCPDEQVSTADSSLFHAFAVEYPCGWHALLDARPNGERPGAISEVLLLSRVPLTMVPGRRVADIEVADWTDDPVAEGDGLGTLDSWVAGERARFAPRPPEERFEVADGTTVLQLAGEQPLPEGGSTRLIVALWEFEQGGRRHIVRAVAIEPSTRGEAALSHLIRSFRLLP